jgi:hypothetical protein
MLSFHTPLVEEDDEEEDEYNMNSMGIYTRSGN